ncbi:helix-turn-helix domain-containing protein [Nonomuraea sp. NPDC049646]|uniref:helix-turn-helix domain-containing protein n=1 Tax=unclassified Nonomuraea TaxID=2593643 RepID=UPI0037A5B93B
MDNDLGHGVGSSDQQIQVRQMVGTRLRRLRIHRNLRQEAAAHALGVSIAKISRMERGLTPFRREDLFTLLNLYGVTDPAQREILISVAVGERSPSWWDDDIPLADTVQWALEHEARRIRVYQPRLVPDLLQIEEYARAVQMARRYPSPPSEAIEAAVKNLLRRQQARTVPLWVVIDETVLWRPIGGDLAMHLRQLDALAAASTGDVTIQILPLCSPFLPVSEPFTIFSLPGKQVLTAHPYGGDRVVNLADAETYGLLWDQLIGVAHRRARTPEILAHIRSHLQSGEGPR